VLNSRLPAPLVLSILKQPVQIEFSDPGDDFRLYAHISEEFGNSEAISLIYQHSRADFSISNAIAQLIYCTYFDLTYDDLISFIASHFWEFSINSFDSLSANLVA
jgi:hypothetical protein